MTCDVTLSQWNLQQDRTANKVNEITDITNTEGPAWPTPAYDPAGNMTSIPRPVPFGLESSGSSSESSESLLSSSSSSEVAQSLTATYDAWNRLVTLKDEDDQPVQVNQYDGRNFRIIREVYVDGTLDETGHFFYTEGWRCIEERIDTETDANQQHIWGQRYIDDCVLRDRFGASGSSSSSSSPGSERLYALQDGNWNVTALVDTAGDVLQRMTYSPYGVPLFLTPDFGLDSSPAFALSILFAGYRWDGLAELFVVRNRIYHPGLGTWMQRDPIGYFSSSNLYEYANSIPNSLFDPLGLNPPVPYPGRKDDPTKSILGFSQNLPNSSSGNRIQVDIYVDSPNPGSDRPGGAYTRGHVSVRVTNLDDPKQMHVTGFWPTNSLAAMHAQPVGGAMGHAEDKKYIEKQMYDYQGTFVTTISPLTYEELVLWAKKYPIANKFDMDMTHGSNCAQFAVDILEKAGADVPRHFGKRTYTHPESGIKLETTTPGALGLDILKHGGRQATPKANSWMQTIIDTFDFSEFNHERNNPYQSFDNPFNMAPGLNM